MSSDFSKMVYRKVEEHVRAQTGGRKFTTKEWRALMDAVMARFTNVFVSIVESVMAQAQAEDAKAKAKAEEEEKAKAAAAAAQPPVPEAPAPSAPAAEQPPAA